METFSETGLQQPKKKRTANKADKFQIAKIKVN